MTQERSHYPHSWMPLLRTSRASAGVLVLCAIGLLLPPQTRDMMSALAEVGWPIVAFHIALMFLGFCAWYWARAATSAEWMVGHSRTERQMIYGESNFPAAAFEWLPRFFFGAAGLIGIVLLSMAWSWPNALLVMGWIAVAWFLLYKRTVWGPDIGEQPRPREGEKASEEPVGRDEVQLGLWRRLAHALFRFVRRVNERWHRLHRFAPFGRTFSGCLLFLALIPFVSGAVGGVIDLPEWWPLRAAKAAELFPGPAAAVLGLGLMIGPLTVITFVLDAWEPQIRWEGLALGPKRIPVLTVLSLWVFVFAPLIFHLHAVRVAKDPLAPGKRTTLDRYFKAWFDECYPPASSGPVRPIIVTLSGGATKAGLWGARVLYDIERATGYAGPAVFAVSSVSGGSLGAATYMALDFGMLRRDGEPFCRPKPVKNRSSALRLDLPAPPNTLYTDALGPTLAAWLLDDIPRAILALVARSKRGSDSAGAIERAFERLWKPFADQAPGTAQFSDPFLQLFYHKDGTIRRGMPLWIGNGTEVTTGNRILTIPVKPDQALREWPFHAALDLLGLLNSDVPISTAINNTARFPILEPFGDVLPPGKSDTRAEVIDGGYFENEGLQTALELVGWLETEGGAVIGRDVEPVVVEATAEADDRVKIGDVVRCGALRGDPTTPTGEQRADPQVLAPILGANNVRGGHSRLLQYDARSSLCQPGDRRYFHFYLPGGGSPPIPLNWILSRAIADRIWHATENEPIGNAQELRCLQLSLRQWTSDSARKITGLPCQ